MMHSEEIIDSLLDQVAKLKAERDALREILDHIPKVEAELEELSYLLRAAEAERDALKADAERYQWLRGNAYAGVNRHNECLWTIRGLYEKVGQSFDSAIDAARGDK